MAGLSAGLFIAVGRAEATLYRSHLKETSRRLRRLRCAPQSPAHDNQAVVYARLWFGTITPCPSPCRPHPHRCRRRSLFLCPYPCPYPCPYRQDCPSRLCRPRYLELRPPRSSAAVQPVLQSRGADSSKIRADRYRPQIELFRLSSSDRLPLRWSPLIRLEFSDTWLRRLPASLPL